MRFESTDATTRIDACTLPTEEQPLRVAEFEELFAAHLVGVEQPAPTRGRLTFDAGAPGVEHQIRDLTARESECCSFFTFTLAPAAQPGRLVLDIEVPGSQQPVLGALMQRAAELGPAS
jgi:hypothetical protein